MKRFLLLILLVLSGHVLFSQSCTIFDKDSRLPVSNVSISNEDNSLRVLSDKNGVADLSVFSTMDILTFNHVTYVEVEILKKQITNKDGVIYLQNKSEILNEVFLSATKTAESRTRIAEQVAVFSAKDIQNTSPQTSADMLSDIPGIKVQRTQFGGGSPVLRGMEANKVLLVVDGVRMNNAIYRRGHLQNAITVSPNLLDRTEVIFGPSSVIYGSDALGGVIHYYTRKPHTSDKTQVNTDFLARFSTINEERTIYGGVELQLKNLATFTSFSYSDFGDLRMGKNRKHNFDDWGKQFFYSDNSDNYYNPDPVENPNPEKQKNIGYKQYDFLQKICVPLDKKTELIFNMQYSTSTEIPRFDKLAEMDEGVLKYAEWYYGPQKRLLLSTQLFLNPEEKWLDNGVITLAYQDIDESRIDRKFGKLDRSSGFENVKVYSLNTDFFVPLKKSVNRNLAYGFEMAYNKVNSSSKGEVLEVNGDNIVGISGVFPVQTRYPDGGSDYLSSAVYLDYRQDLSKKSTLNSGIRLTNTNLNAKWVDDTFITLPDSDIHLQNTAVTLTLGYAHKPSDKWQLNSVFSSGFRSPNIDDIGKVREKRGKVTVPNVDLKPEFAYNAEFGILRFFKEKNYLLNFTVYYTLLDNYIYRDPFILNGSSTILWEGESYDMVANVNKGAAYVTGGTFVFKGNITNTLKTKASVTYTKGKTYDTNEPLSSIPPVFGNMEIAYVKNRLETGLNLVYNGRKKLEDYNIPEGIDNIEETPFLEDKDEYYGSPSWETLNFFSKYKVTKNIDLLFAVDNIFDRHYKEFASGISAPGRNFSLSVLAGF
ncbi:MAG: TonB-dependent receptor [Bacteroidota bacterium]